jgi:membrane peptidoglycan carboxypeptidase
VAKDKGTTDGGSDSGAERTGLTTTGEGLFHRLRTGEWPVLKIDLSEAYASVRRRAAVLRRRRIISGILVGLLLAGLVGVATTYYANAIPLPGELTLPETTTVYYSDGTTVMARLGTQRRTIVRTDRLPRYVAQAVIAAEDPRYYTTSGTLISRQYARAATIATGGSVDGAAGQARLLVMTWRLEDSYSKEEILDFYLNTVYFGRGAYGIEEAARTYFGVGADRLTLAQAILLAGMIESPGDGRFDPTVDVVSATTKFATVAQTMVSLGMIDQETASRLTVPTVLPYDPGRFASGLSEPTGLIVAQVLAELRATDEFRDRPPGYLEDGGYAIITTIDVNVQRLLLQTVDENEPDSLLSSGPRSLTAAAVVVEPRTGRVLAYYGGPNGTGADYAGTRATPDGGVAGFGYHPPAQTMTVYTLAAALDAGISAASRWDAPSIKEFPASGRTGTDALRDVRSAECQPACTLAEAAIVPLSIPFYAVTERIGPAAVIETARAAGIGAMWSADPESGLVRHDLGDRPVRTLVPEPFTADVALGRYPVTVLDQATAMATFAAGGLRARTHFVNRVVRDYATVYEGPSEAQRVLSADVVADVTAVLAQNPAGQIPDGPPTAGVAGTALLAGSAIDAAHAWYVGYTPDLAMAVWVGNKEYEFPLRNAIGDRITGETMPAQIFRRVVAGATDALGLGDATFPEPARIGDDTVGDAPASGAPASGAPASDGR